MSYPIVKIRDTDATTLLDCNDGTTTFIPPNGFDLGTAEIERALFLPDGSDGGTITKERLRPCEMEWRQTIVGSSVDNAREIAGTLSRLLRAGGEIEFQHNAAAEVRYIDFLGLNDVPSYLRGSYGIPAQYVTVTSRIEEMPVSILRQPTQRAAAVTGTAYTLNVNPAAASNPLMIPVSNPGAAPAPIYLTLTAGSQANFLLALRSKGNLVDFTATTKAFQSEAGTLVTDATLATDASTNGGANNVVNVSFATATNVKRVEHAYNTLMDARRGTFRVYANVRKTVGGDSILAQFRYRFGGSAVVQSNDQAAVTGTSFYWQDLGIATIPDITDFTSGVFEIWAERTSGTGALRIDYIALVPIDEEFAIIESAMSSGDLVVDGENRIVYRRSSGAVVELPPSLTVKGNPFFCAPPGESRLMIIPLQSGNVPTLGGSHTAQTTIKPRHY